MAEEDGGGAEGFAPGWLSQGCFMFREGVDPKSIAAGRMASGDGSAAVDVDALASQVVAPRSAGGVAPPPPPPAPKRPLEQAAAADVQAGGQHGGPQGSVLCRFQL